MRITVAAESMRGRSATPLYMACDGLLFFGSGGRAFGPARAAGPRPACVGGADTYGERQLLEIQAGVRPYISLAPADC